MYRILPKKLIFLGFGWLIIGLLTLAHLAEQLTHYQVKASAIPGVAWLVLSAGLWNPVWRKIWKIFPSLNKWFPDLNGFWDVELCSNWPRQEQLIAAAADEGANFDIRKAPDDQLAAMQPIKLLAEISQTWWKFEMKLTNPRSDTPIDRSDTINIDPIAAAGLLPAGICYFYKQTNATDTVSDDAEFYGAARLSYDADKDELKGLVWTARMWRRAMNTAGSATFRRRKDA